MASTVTASGLTVTVIEQINLNGVNYGSRNSITIGSIKEVYKRIVRCADDSDCTIAVFKADNYDADGAITLANVRYIRVTNLDDTNPMNLSLQIAGGESGTANMSTTILASEVAIPS